MSPTHFQHSRSHKCSPALSAKWSDHFLSELKEHAQVKPLKEVVRRLGNSPVVSVSNRSTTQLSYTPEHVIEFQRPAGGVGPSLEVALRQKGNAVVYATAMSSAEKILAQRNLLVSRDDTVWIRYVYLPEIFFQQFYSDITNHLLYMILHGMPEHLIRMPNVWEFIRHPVAWSRYGIRSMFSWIAYQCSPQLRPRDYRLIYTRRMQISYGQGYRWVNQEYARILAHEGRMLDNPKLLVHDHHFSLVPRFLRQDGFSERIAVFIHVPWPSPNVFCSALPRPVATDMVKGLLASDLIGFHTPTYVRNFRETTLRLLGANIHLHGSRFLYRENDSRVRVQLVANPITVDQGMIENAIRSSVALEFMQMLREKVGHRILIVRSERIDMMKGLYEGLAALRALLTRYEELRAKIQLFAVLQPSRLHIREYKKYYNQVHCLARKINKEFAKGESWDAVVRDEAQRRSMFDVPRWPPVVLFEYAKPFEEIIAAYAVGDLGFFSSLVDGMNLSIKEFAIVNNPRLLRSVNHQLLERYGQKHIELKPGIAVASEKMGAYRELHGCVLNVSYPTDIESMVSVLYRGIQFVLQQRDRTDQLASELADRIHKQTLKQWLQRMTNIASPSIPKSRDS